MITLLKDAMEKIDKQMVKKWVHDLVVIKTFAGLRFQEVILKKVAEIYGKEYKLSDNYEESQGIDGYIGDLPVSVKPVTYKTKEMLMENITAAVIYYDKGKDGIIVDYSEADQKLKG